MSFLQALYAYFIDPILSLLILAIIVNIILSWLINFNVINNRNQFVSIVWKVSHAIVEPVLRPIRRIIPPLGGLDFSPVFLFLLIQFIKGYIFEGLLLRII